MNAPCTTPIPITFFWGCSTSHFSRPPFQHDLQCLGSDALLYLPRHHPSKCQCLVCARKLRVQLTRVPLPPPQFGTHGLHSSALCSLGSPPDHACGPHSYFLLPSVEWAKLTNICSHLHSPRLKEITRLGFLSLGCLLKNSCS